MKLGLIARCEIARGIAIQSRNFYDHMPVDRVLLVRMPRPDCTEAPEWYDNRTEVAYDAKYHRLDEDTVKGWLDGLDVVFTVETPNDWRIPTWCKEMGVKLVIQGNPEFVRHLRPEGAYLPHPDAWWWPTSWRLPHLPKGEVVPVPMDRRYVKLPEGSPMKVVHVVGKRAWGDRNGTDLLAPAMRQVSERVHLTVHTIDGDLPQFSGKLGRKVTLDLVLDTVEDRWSMYDSQNVMVLPRRYGGLCLPALEAMASGLVVVMPSCSPNEELAGVTVQARRARDLNMACGPVATYDVLTAALASKIDELARWHAEGALPHLAALQPLPTWEQWRPQYLKKLEAICEG